MLLCLFFGYEWYEQKVKFRAEDPDEWMLNGSDVWLAAHPVDNDVRRIIYTHRVIRLANALFVLMRAPAKGLEVLKERFLARSTKSCFIEAEIASSLVFNGFQVEILKEHGKKGEDFDLLATKDGATISVEVTSKLDGALTVKRIKNTLQAKRRQVSPDRPAVLYIHVPADWMRLELESMPVFDEAFQKFMSSSRRFNVIVLASEAVVPYLNGGIPTTLTRACFNNRPRHPLEHPGLFQVQLGKTASFLERLRSTRAATAKRRS